MASTSIWDKLPGAFKRRTHAPGVYTRPLQPAVFGLLAEFDTPAQLYKACEAVRDKGFSKWDAHTPFPVHGLDGAMGLSRSPLPFIVLVMGLIGACGGFALQTWIHTEAYPIIFSGKPYWSWPAFIPVTFECGILFASFGAVFGMFVLNGLPETYHPVFNSERFERVTDDKFFISIEAVDPNYNEEETRLMLQKLGAAHVEVLEK